MAAVAAAVGCTASNIYKIEQGSSQPSPEVYAALKVLLDVGDADLVDELARSAA